VVVAETTLMKLPDLFKEYGDEFLEFDRVVNKRSMRRDLHVFIILDELFPGNDRIVSAAEHDEIFLCVTPDELAAVATKEQVLELIRAGLRYDRSTDSLAMFA
jgi:hypothetical protein